MFEISVGHCAPRVSRLYPQDRELNELQGRSGRGKKEQILPMPGFRESNETKRLTISLQNNNP